MNDHNLAEFDPRQATPSVTAGYRVPGNLYKLGKACDEWLQKRYALEGRKVTNQWYKSGQHKPPAVDSATKALAVRIRDHRPKPKAKAKAKAPKPKKQSTYTYRYQKRNRAKYSTEAERTEAKRQGALSRWNAMTPEQRAAHVEKMAAKRKKPANPVPRHLRPEWAEYRREWQRQHRQKTVLTPEQIEERRRKSRELYARQDPEKKRQQNAQRRQRQKAKKADQAALRAAAPLNTKLAA